MSERTHSRSKASPDIQRFLMFRANDAIYALPAEGVREIILPPVLAKVPLSPKPLLGLANLRGVVLPVASLSLLLGRGDQTASPSQRVVVLDERPAFGLLVDEVLALTPVPAEDIAVEEAQLAATDGETVIGAFAIEGAGDIAHILDIQALLAQALGLEGRGGQLAEARYHRQDPAASPTARTYETFITFEVAGQEFGLPIDNVREVLKSADISAPLPRSEAAVLGMTALRSTLLPLVSMRALLGFPSHTERPMTLVASIAGVSVGLAVDRVRDIVRIEPSELEPVPAVIAGRTQGEASIQSVIKAESGDRLIAILDPEKLFREDVMGRIKASVATPGGGEPMSATNASTRTFLVFTLGGQEFGLAISAVEEVARLPTDITRLPKAPDFLKGVVNLRGAVLPIVDQRKRFDLPDGDQNDRQRLVIVRIDATVAGFIVDSVSEVLRVAADAVDPPPDVVVSARVLEGVVNLEASGRMVLLLDPSQLLSRTEQGLLDALGGTQEAHAAVDQGLDR